MSFSHPIDSAPRDGTIVIGTFLVSDGSAADIPMVWSKARSAWCPVELHPIVGGLQPDGWRPPADDEL